MEDLESIPLTNNQLSQSSSHRAYLVQFVSHVWFASYCTMCRLPNTHLKDSDCEFPKKYFKKSKKLEIGLAKNTTCLTRNPKWKKRTQYDTKENYITIWEFFSLHSHKVFYIHLVLD